MRGEAEPRDRSLMYRHTWDLALVSSALFGLGCQNSDQPPGSVGPDLEVRVAALSLEGPDEVCFDLRVDNQSGIVWQRGNPLVTKLGADQTAAPGSASSAAPDTATICSSLFGNGPGGDITWVGTCDASSDSGAADGVQNDVTLWVDGLYKNGAELADWRDPCPTGCTIEVDCRANADNLARFDLTSLCVSRTTWAMETHAT